MLCPDSVLSRPDVSTTDLRSATTAPLPVFVAAVGPRRTGDCFPRSGRVEQGGAAPFRYFCTQGPVFRGKDFGTLFLGGALRSGRLF